MFDNLAQKLFGAKRAESDSVLSDAGTNTIHGTAVTDSSNGSVMVELSSDVTNPDPIEVDGEMFFDDADTSVELPTTQNVKEGDDVLVSVLGNTPLRSPVVTGVVGSGDRIAADAEAAREIAEATGQHFWDDDNGAHVTELPREEWEQQQTGPNSLWNSLGMLFRDGLNNLLAIVTGQNPGLQIFDGQGNADENILAEFSASKINIGRSYADDGLTQASVGFFDGDTLLDAQHYVTGGSTYQDLYLSTKLEGEAAGQDVRSSLGTHLETDAKDGYTYDRAETAMTAAAAPQGMSAAELSVSAGYDGKTLTRLLSAKADNVFLTSLQSQSVQGVSWNGTMAQVIISLARPMATWTGTSGTVTDGAGWHQTDFKTMLAQHGPWSDYFTLSGGRITALKDVTLQLTMDLSWNDNVMGIRGAGFFKNSAVGSGVNEISSFSAKGANNRFYCVFPPRLISLKAGEYLNIGRYNQLANSIFTRGTNYTWLTVEVVG